MDDNQTTPEVKITPINDISKEMTDTPVVTGPTKDTDPPETPPTPKPAATGTSLVVEEVELSEDTIKSYLEKNYNTKIEKLESLFEAPEPQVVEKEIELEEDVAAFRKYKKETGRGLEDFMKLQKDFSTMDPDQILIEQYSIDNPSLSRDEVRFMLERKFGFDPEFDSEGDIQEKKLLKKSEVAKAIDKLNGMKAQYSTPLESRGLDVPDDVKADFEAYRQQKAKEAEQTELSNARTKSFIDKTMEVFPEDFKGFDFSVGEGKSITFKPEDTDKIIQKQTNLAGWLDGFKDENGFIKDAQSFHKAVNMAMYGEALIKHVYEQGKADQVVEFEQRVNNIDMPIGAPPPVTVSGLKISSYDPG